MLFFCCTGNDGIWKGWYYSGGGAQRHQVGSALYVQGNVQCAAIKDLVVQSVCRVRSPFGVITSMLLKKIHTKHCHINNQILIFCFYSVSFELFFGNNFLFFKCFCPVITPGSQRPNSQSLTEGYSQLRHRGVLPLTGRQSMQPGGPVRQPYAGVDFISPCSQGLSIRLQNIMKNCLHSLLLQFLK